MKSIRPVPAPTLAIGLLAFALVVPARADSIPAATDNLFFGGGLGSSNTLPGAISASVSYPGTCDLSGCSGSESASATVTPGVSASASCVDCSFGSPGIVSAVVTDLTYSFEIEGPVSEEVPIIFSYNETGSASALASAFGTPAWGIDTEFSINASPSFSDEFSVANSGYPCEERVNDVVVGTVSCSGFAETGQTELSLMSNTIYSIGLNADILFVTDANVSASVDPYIQIDPSFSDAGLFTVEVSPGIGNSPLTTTPEPSSVVLTSTLLLALAFAVRKRGVVRM